MTNFGWWAGQVPEGYFLCVECFEGRPVEEAWADETGQRWDVCRACKAAEEVTRPRPVHD